MARNRKIKPPKSKGSLIDNALQGRKVTDEIEEKHLVFSFKYLDETQGSTINEWEKLELWGTTIDKIRNYCKMTRIAACQGQGNSMTVYGDFPHLKRTDFTHPPSIPEDAKWASVHIMGKRVLAGHIYDNLFFVVFLDANHNFYKTKRKTGK